MDADLYELQRSFDRLRGRLFQALEATGMPERQEEAAKGVIRSITYDGQQAIEGAVFHAQRPDNHRREPKRAVGRVRHPNG